MNSQNDRVRAIVWADDHLQLLDQRRLPHVQTWLAVRDLDAGIAAIRDMVVRGAPAIGIAAAYTVVIAAEARFRASPERWRPQIEEDLTRLGQARPTAVNLAWALSRMSQAIDSACQAADSPVPQLLAQARALHAEDIAANHRMGAWGAGLIPPGSGVLTHCNTGALATGGYGTALGVIRSAYGMGRLAAVYADETRPWLQGARLTAWELVQEGIPVTLIVEGAAAALLRSGRVQWVIVGADRIAANGDTANKIGTYALAVLARHHGVKFMVVAPTSTFDFSRADGSGIPIETRPESELLTLAGQPVAAPGAGAWNPVFDVTPADMIDAIVTERGVVARPDRDRLAAMNRDRL